MVNADDKRLISRCLNGQTDAFGELVSRYQDRLFNTVFRYLGNAEDARDVVQEAFLNAYQSLDSFKGDSLFFTWLYRIAVNTAISWKRKQKPILSFHSGGKDNTSLEPLDSSETAHPGYALETREEQKRLQTALSRLSPEHRSVLVMKDIDGQKYEDIAEILDVPIGTIRSRLHRARLDLRTILSQQKEREEKC